MSVVTRFAPSPTGFLHIGGARTALFNWLYARRHGGRFLLRIEDTDRARSTPEAIAAIHDALTWLDLTWDGEAVSQFARAERHAEVAQMLLDRGLAYWCYATPEELSEMRERQRQAGEPVRYDGRWRDRDPAEAPAGVPPALRFRAPREGETEIEDRVQGTVRVANKELDDMVLLRADGSPTYMFAVVVDDHDMGITHVIRGDDHLTNAFRQTQLFRALDWAEPIFAHIPLIHGPDGAKLSKRHGALGAEAYRDMGFLPEAMRNYLLRLGWGHGDDEIISTEQAISWFDLDGIGRSPARFDVQKLTHLNAHYIRESEEARLFDGCRPFLEKIAGQALDASAAQRVRTGMPGLKPRAKTLLELAETALVYVRTRPLEYDEKAQRLISENAETLSAMKPFLAAQDDWTADRLESAVRMQAESLGVKLGKLAQPLRAAIVGVAVSPPLFEVMEIWGREECLARLNDATAQT